MTWLFPCLHQIVVYFQECSPRANGLTIYYRNFLKDLSSLQQKTSIENLNLRFFELLALTSLPIVGCCIMICTQFWTPFWKTHLKSYFRVSVSSVLGSPHSEILKPCKVVFILTEVSDKLKYVLSPVCVGNIWGASFWQLRNFALREVYSSTIKSSTPLKCEDGPRWISFKMYIIKRHKSWCQKVALVVRIDKNPITSPQIAKMLSFPQKSENSHGSLPRPYYSNVPTKKVK